MSFFLMTAKRTGTAPAIAVGLSSSAKTVVQGSTTTITVTLTRTNYTGTVTPSVTGLPTDVTGSWSDSSLTGSETTTILTLTAAIGAPLVSNDAFTVTMSGSGVTDATAAATVTVSVVSGTPFFSETFETGTFSGGTLGATTPGVFCWDSGPQGSAFVSATDPITGSYSFINRYPATSTEGNSEYKFWLGSDVSQMWLEYDWLVPTNFVHAAFEATNQIKMFAFWRDNYGSGTAGPAWVSEIRRTSDTESWFRAMSTKSDVDYVAGLEDFAHTYHLGTGSRFISATGPVTPGVVANLRFNFKPASTNVATDGHWKCWVDGVLFFSATGNFYSTNVATVPTPEVRRGYLMGYSNSGFAAVTDFRTDNINFYNADPGWV